MPINPDDAILMVLREAGSSDAQIADAKLILGPLCHMSGTNCVLADTGEPLESAKSMAWLREHKAHLLPPNTADLDTAFLGVGNKTAAQKVILERGKAEADRLAGLYGKRHALDNRPGVSPQQTKNGGDKPNDHSKNPFSKAGWSLKKQGELVRALGVEKASAMAKAVGVSIGATRPVM